MKARFRAAKPAILAFVPAWVLCAVLRKGATITMDGALTPLFVAAGAYFVLGCFLSRHYGRGKGAPWTETGAITLLLLADLALCYGLEWLVSAADAGEKFGAYLCEGLLTAVWRLGYALGAGDEIRFPLTPILAILLAAVMAGAFVLGFHWRARLPGDGSEPR